MGIGENKDVIVFFSKFTSLLNSVPGQLGGFVGSRSGSPAKTEFTLPFLPRRAAHRARSVLMGRMR